MQNHFFLATINKNKPDGEHEEKNLDQNDKTYTCGYKTTWATDTDDFLLYTSEAAFITKYPLLDLGHRLKEMQVWFGGTAIASPAVYQVARATKGVQSKQATITTTWCHFRCFYLRPSVVQTDLPWMIRALKQHRCLLSWERQQITGKVSRSLRQSDIEINLDKRSSVLLLFVCLLFKWIHTDI